MSHVICDCGSTEHVSGYGLAAGGIGSYTICMDCSAVIEFVADESAQLMEPLMWCTVCGEIDDRHLGDCSEGPRA